MCYDSLSVTTLLESQALSFVHLPEPIDLHPRVTHWWVFLCLNISSSYCLAVGGSWALSLSHAHTCKAKSS